MDKKFKYKMLSEDDDEDKEMMQPIHVEQEEVSELQKAKNEHYFSKQATNVMGEKIAQELAAKEMKAQEVPSESEELKKMKLLKLKKYGVK